MRNIIKQEYPNMKLFHPYTSWMQIVEVYKKNHPECDTVIFRLYDGDKPDNTELEAFQITLKDVKAMAFDEIMKTAEPIKSDFKRHHYILTEMRDAFSNDIIKNVLDLIHKVK